MSTKNEVAPKKGDQLPAVIDFAADAGGGFEEADREAYAIPFLRILQSTSKQCKKAEPEYIKGAEEGFAFNTVTEELIDITKDGIRIIPCHYTRRMIEWVPQSAGGGFVAEHLPEDAPVGEWDDEGNFVLPNGNELADTRNHYVLVITAAGITPALISMSGSQMKKSKKWMMQMNMRRHEGKPLPMFGSDYSFSAVPESNDKGSWYGWKITAGNIITDPELYNMAKDFRAAVISGEAKEVHDKPAEDSDNPVDF